MLFIIPAIHKCWFTSANEDFPSTKPVFTSKILTISGALRCERLLATLWLVIYMEGKLKTESLVSLRSPDPFLPASSFKQA